MTDFADLNVFQMLAANDGQPGLWLRRTTWANTCACVTSVEPFAGPPPYYGNPKVFADIYDVMTGEFKERGARLPVPGTFKTWRQIDPPAWANPSPIE